MGGKKELEEPTSALISWLEESKRAGVGCGKAGEGASNSPWRRLAMATSGLLGSAFEFRNHGFVYASRQNPEA